MAPVNDRLMDRIRKVSALAERAGTEAEAVAAALQLQRLLSRYGLSEEDIAELSNDKQKSVEDAVVDETGKIVDWKGWLGTVIAENFRCTCIWGSKFDQKTWKPVRTLRFIGLDEDVAAASLMYRATVAVMYKLKDKHIIARQQRDLARGYKWSRSDSIQACKSYFAGFILGLDEAFKEQVAGAAGAIVLVQDAMVKKVVDDMGLTEHKSNSNYTGDASALFSGKKDGKAFAGGNALGN